MSLFKVYKVVLMARTSNSSGQIEVTLYRGGGVVGTCGPHSGNWSTMETLNCEKVVADSLMLTAVNSTETTQRELYLVVRKLVVRGQQYYCFDKITPIAITTGLETKSSQDVYTADLYNASQSSTWCYIGVCYNANRGIDGDTNTISQTEYRSGLHWWRVKMSPLRVYKVVLEARTSSNSRQIEVTLYWRGAVVGTCESHSGNRSYAHRWEHLETLTCNKVAADSVKLTVNSTEKTRLNVYEMTVIGVQYYDLDSVELHNATQSSTRCNYNASRAIDGNETTYSLTEYTNSTSSSTNQQYSSHWLRVSMSPGKVQKVVIKAGTDGVKIDVELYREDELVGKCRQHPGDGRASEISCDAVSADSLKLTVNSGTDWTDFCVWDIKVRRIQLPNWVYVLASGLGLLGIFNILANSMVIGFYLKKRQDAVPLMYIMIAICDSITGFVAVCHSFIFTNYPAVAHILKGGYYWDTESDWFIITLYVILQSATRVSLFYNTILTVVRTINITQPFYLIKKHILILSAVVYPVLTVITMITTAAYQEVTDTLSMVFMVFPGVEICVDKQGDTTTEKRALFMIIMMAIPLILPPIINIICAALQIFSIAKPSTFFPTTHRERSMTITIIVLTLLCMICNIPYTVFLLFEFTVNFDVGRISYKMLPLVFYSLCTLLPFMQAVLNPMVLLIRGAALRTFVLETISFPFNRRNPDDDGIEMQVLHNKAGLSCVRKRDN